MSNIRKEISDIYQVLRAKGDALARAKDDREGMKAWSTSDQTVGLKDANRVCLHEFQNVVDFFNNVLPGGIESLCADKFKINYNIYGDVDRPCELGRNTRGLDVEVEWGYSPVTVHLYSGIGDSVTTDPKLKQQLNHGVRDRKILANTTALDMEEVKRATPEAIDSLTGVFKLSIGAQHKLTRLVKGCLIYLDLINAGMDAEFDISMDSIRYDVQSLADQYGKKGVAYVYSHWPNNEAYTSFIYMMSCSYPNPWVEGVDYVHIPADGEKVIMVAHKAFSSSVNAILTPSLAWASLVAYCDHFGVGHQLEQAMIIACSLYENRYFTRVDLPRVVSYPDLVAPSLMKVGYGFESKPIADSSLTKAVGRIHQMMSLTLGKDALYSAINTTQPSYDYLATMQSYLSSQEQRFLKLGYSNMTLSLLSQTAAMKWLSVLSKDDMEEMITYSIFEGLWLVDQCDAVMKNGVLQNMKHGVKDMVKGYFDILVHVDDETVLEREIELAGIDYNDIDIPVGGYTIDVCYLDFNNNQSDLLDRVFRKTTCEISYEVKKDGVREKFQRFDSKRESERVNFLKKKRDEREAKKRHERENLDRALSGLDHSDRDNNEEPARPPPKMEERKPRTFASIGLKTQGVRIVTPDTSQPASPLVAPLPPSRPTTPVSVVGSGKCVGYDELDQAEAGLVDILEKKMTETMGRMGFEAKSLKYKPFLVENLMDFGFFLLEPNSVDPLVNELIRKGRRNTLKAALEKRQNPVQKSWLETHTAIDEVETMMLQGDQWIGTITPDLYPFLYLVRNAPVVKIWARDLGVREERCGKFFQILASGFKSREQAKNLAQALEFEEKYDVELRIVGVGEKLPRLVKLLKKGSPYGVRKSDSMQKRGKDGDNALGVLVHASVELGEPVAETKVLKRIMLSVDVPKKDRDVMRSIFADWD